MAGMTTRLQPSARACAALLPFVIGVGPVLRKPKSGPATASPGI
jgi:hypothetical protein